MDQQPAPGIWALTWGCWASLPASFPHVYSELGFAVGQLDCVWLFLPVVRKGWAKSGINLWE